MRIYFAHPITDYGTPIEAAAITLIHARFPNAEIINPNTPEHECGYQRAGMSYFLDEVLPSCDACVWMAFENGMIGAGVAAEVQHFEDRGCPTWEVFARTDWEDAKACMRVLSVDETRAARAEALRLRGAE